MRYEIYRKCLLLIACVMIVGWFASPSWATPPTPPAAIAMEDAQLTKLESRDGSLFYRCGYRSVMRSKD